jgi:heme-degrading monooxygenase HmoA
MITRLWHGYTTPENADAYEALVRSEILPDFQRAKGFLGGELLRRDLLDEVEFVGLTYFDSLESMRAFAGEDFGHSIVSESARKLLSSFDQRTALYSVVLSDKLD